MVDPLMTVAFPDAAERREVCRREVLAFLPGEGGAELDALPGPDPDNSDLPTEGDLDIPEPIDKELVEVEGVPMRRIKKAKIDFISLVPKGANRLPVLYKSDGLVGGRAAFGTLVKADMDNGEITAVVYAPEFRDAQGDIASADVIKEMAYEFQRSGGQIDLRHDGKALSRDEVYVAESFLVQKGDTRFAGMLDYDGKPVADLTGSWAVVIKVESEDLRKLYREGKWAGVSMAGAAEVVETSKEDPLDALFEDRLSKVAMSRSTQLLNRLAAHLGLTRAYAHQSITLTGDIDMTPEQLTKVLTDSNAALAKSITEANKEANKQILIEAGLIKDPAAPVTKADEKPAKPTEKPAPIFKGDYSDEVAVRRFEYDHKRYLIEKSIDTSDPQSVIDGAAEIAELNKEYEDVAAKPKQGKPAPSNAGGSPDSNSTGLSKEMQDCVSVGSNMAKLANASRGY
jgi:hypothetical protein